MHLKLTNRNHWLTALILSVALFNQTGAQTTTPAPINLAFEKQIPTWMNETNVPAVGIGIIENGKLKYAKVFGDERPISCSQPSTSFSPKVLLIHTGLQPGEKAFRSSRNRFNGFSSETGKPLKRFSAVGFSSNTGLKPGVNETTFEAKPRRRLQQVCDQRDRTKGLSQAVFDDMVGPQVPYPSGKICSLVWGGC